MAVATSLGLHPKPLLFALYLAGPEGTPLLFFGWFAAKPQTNQRKTFFRVPKAPNPQQRDVDTALGLALLNLNRWLRFFPAGNIAPARSKCTHALVFWRVGMSPDTTSVIAKQMNAD